LLDEHSAERRRAIEGLQRVRDALTPGDPSRSTADRVAALAAELVA
jgi:hypothetical protein